MANDDHIPQEQMELFRELIAPSSNEEGQQSNLLDVWDAIPKYCVPRLAQSKLRDKNGQLPIYKHTFKTVDGNVCEMTIEPAAVYEIDKDTGKTVRRDYYPSTTEELIEEVLRRFFLLEDLGSHEQGSESKSWVKFTQRMIYDELKRYNKSRNMTEIQQALKIMSSSRIQFTINGKQAYDGAILPERIFRNRKEYESNPGSLAAVRFSSMFSSAIDRLEFRQYNYSKTMGHTGDLTRWLQKHLSKHFINAATQPKLNYFKISYNNISELSGMLHHSKLYRKLQVVRSSLEELVTSGTLVKFDEEIEKDRGGKKYIGANYKLYPSDQFVKEMKAANFHQKKLTGRKARARLIGK